MKNVEEIESMLEIIEKINLENLKYKSTKEYLIHKKREDGKKILKEKGFLKFLYFNYKKNKLIKMYKIIKENGKKYDTINKTNKEHKVAIYTAITGNYDKVSEPVFVPKNCTYILFTDNQNIKSDKWEIRPIPEKIKKINNNILINRYIKMHPKELLDEFDYSIYIDGNIKTVSDLTSMIKEINEKTGLAIHRHYLRNCIYKESKACIFFGKGNIKKMKKQVKKYKEEGFPKNYGLLECSIIISNLKNSKSEEILNKWWDEFIESKSNRDQISLPYVLWKNGNNIEDIGDLGNNLYLNSKFRVEGHN